MTWFKVVDTVESKLAYIGRDKKLALKSVKRTHLSYDFFVSKVGENGPWWYVTYAEFIVR